MDKSVLFIGPVAQTGGPAIKNSILIRHLEKKTHLECWNTYDRSVKARIGAVKAILTEKQRHLIVAVSRKGRNLLYPFLLLKSRMSGIRYSCIVIGGNAVGSFRSNASVQAMRGADLVTVETRGLKKQMEETYGLSNVYWMPNYKEVRPGDMAVPSEERFQGETLRFLFLSSMRNPKGVRTLLRAFEQVLADGCKAELDFYGPIKSDLDPELLDQINSADHIHYCGPADNDKVLDIMKEHQVFVFPTEYIGEGFPAVLVEAQMAGLPVIASDMNDNPEIVADGRNGWIFQRGSIVQLAERIRYCVDHREELAQMSAANLEDAKEFDAVLVLERYFNELRKLGWPV